MERFILLMKQGLSVDCMFRTIGDEKKVEIVLSLLRWKGHVKTFIWVDVIKLRYVFYFIGFDWLNFLSTSNSTSCKCFGMVKNIVYVPLRVSIIGYRKKFKHITPPFESVKPKEESECLMFVLSWQGNFLMVCCL